MTSHIGSTASITLLTGLPGSGKTLRMVQFIDEAIKAGEVVFVTNLNGLKLTHIPFEDPTQWRDLPSGSVLVVDEAQQFFRTRRGGDAPEYITAMETIRHQGVRLVLATQQPNYLDTHLRGLVGMHEHLLRVNGKPQSKIWRHNEVMENVRSEKARSRYDSETWDYPKQLFDAYESAQVHTVKPVMSSRMKRGLMIGGVALAALSFVAYGFTDIFSGLRGSDESPAPVQADSAPGAVAPVQGPGTTSEPTAVDKHKPEAIAEYMANLQPRAPSLPWSAPIYDGRAAVAQPRVFCISSGDGYNGSGEWSSGSYHCQTEQGTRVMMPEAEAKMIARWGEPYNPYKAPQAEAIGSGAAPAPVESVASVDRPVAVRGGVGTVGRPLVDREFGTITRPAL